MKVVENPDILEFRETVVVLKQSDWVDMFIKRLVYKPKVCFANPTNLNRTVYKGQHN